MEIVDYRNAEEEDTDYKPTLEDMVWEYNSRQLLVYEVPVTRGGCVERSGDDY